jgi:hypothetical protein
MGLKDEIKIDKVERGFKKLLQESGLIGLMPNYDRNIGSFMVIKVLEGDELEIIDHFRNLSENYKFRTAVKQYEGKGDIWIFKAYID